MSLSITLKVNGRIIATADAINTNGDDFAGEFDVSAFTFPNKFSGTEKKVHKLKITDHNIYQSPWELAKKVTQLVADAEKEQ